ncbi:hypothetical protein Droror1_Dr00001776 [Drosera rotundifolia]
MGFVIPSSLHVLDLYNNNLTGPLPISVVNMTGLRHLHLGGNYFEGEIPKEYGQIGSLEYLVVSGNELTGRIPVEIGNLTRLRELYVGYFNSYEGGIPAEIGNLSELWRFDATNCGLSGRVPEEIGRLRKLDTLFLQVNVLKEPLTPEIGDLMSLKLLDLSNNAFEGGNPRDVEGFGEPDAVESVSESAPRGGVGVTDGPEQVTPEPTDGGGRGGEGGGREGGGGGGDVVFPWRIPYFVAYFEKASTN